MHDLRKIAHVCLDEVIAAGITPGKISGFTINRRLSRAWGRCVTHNATQMHTIEIQPFLLADATPLDVLKNVLIHEILHTCWNCQNHGTTWKAHADRINARYGYNISRLVSAEEIAACKEAGTYQRKPRRAKEPARYVLECMGCGQRIVRSRESAFVQCPSAYRCGICKGDHWKRTVL